MNVNKPKVQNNKLVDGQKWDFQRDEEQQH